MTESTAREDELAMWVVYNSPPDYPGKFVARCWVIRRGEDEPRAVPSLCIAPTLEFVRGMLPWGLHRQERRPEDDQTIVEVWL